ncbi:MAG: histidine phosphatase family protein [Dehalococcoidia bacterium]|nr:histidine phosphatase family protein [Dehalococcoidia bacterium]
MTRTAVATRGPATSDAVYSVAVDEALEHLFGLADTATTELVLVRHAEPDHNRALRAGGAFDPALSERGRCQAMRLAMRLRPADIAAIYTSTARAAVETAAVVAAAKDMPMIRAPQLRDPAVHGCAARAKESDPQRLVAEATVRFLNRPRWDALPGLERSKQFRHRVVQALEGVVSHHSGKTVVVVTHQGVINAYLSMILDIPRDVFFLPDYTSLSVVRILSDRYGVRHLNDTAHLLPAGNPRG